MRALAVLTLASALTPSAAWASCGDFGPLQATLGVMFGSGAGILTSLTSAAVIKLADSRGPFGAMFLSGAFVGGVVTPLTTFSVSASTCEPSDLGAAIALQTSLSAGMAIAGSVAGYFLFREEGVSVTYEPREGGGVIALGGRF